MRVTTFIYALCEPGTRVVRYIGKTNDPRKRLGQHLRVSVKLGNYLGAWLRGLVNRGEKPNMVVLREIPFTFWKTTERRYIRIAKGLGIKLMNSTDGGEGVTMTPETRAKIGARNKGKVRSPEFKTYLSILNGADKHPFFGKHHTPETRAKIGAAQKGKKHSLEQRSAQSLASRGRRLSSETRAKIGAAHRGKTVSLETRAKISSARSRHLGRVECNLV